MSLRMGIRPLMVCSALLALASAAFAQNKVAVISLQQAVFNSAEIQKANAEMTAKYKVRDDEIQQITAQSAAAQKKLQEGQDTLSPEALAALDAQASKLQRDLQRKQEDLQADLQRDREEILSNSSERMAAIVKKIADERGIDVVVEATGTIYYKPAVDITKDATAAYDLAYPVKAAPAKPAAK